MSKPKSDRFITERAERTIVVAQLAVKQAKGQVLTKAERELLDSWK